jgi:translation initiation factor 5
MEHDIFIVNGAHDADKLLNLLYAFIRRFVLCPKCNNPETTLTVANQTIRSRCAACGNDYTIPKQQHKLTTYIINHPPDAGCNTATGSNVASKPANGGTEAKVDTKAKAKKETKSSKKDKNGHSPTNGHSNGENGDSNGHHQHHQDDGNDDFDDDELTAEAYAERMRALGDGINGSMYLSDQKESANFFYKLVRDKKQADKLQDPQVQKDLFNEAARVEFKDKATLILSELLFTESILEEIKTHRLLFLRFCHDNKKAQKYLLGGFEKLVGDVYKDTLFSQSALILKQFYDQDILDEEVIIEWSAKESKKYVSKEMSKKIHDKVLPFIKWLKEAEVEDDDGEEEENKTTNGNGKSHSPTSSENGKPNGNGKKNAHNNNSGDDDEDDDDIEVDFSHRVQGLQLSTEPLVKSGAAKAATGPVDDDDLDIDNI